MSVDLVSQVGQDLLDLSHVNSVSELEEEAIKLLLLYVQNLQSTDQIMHVSRDALANEAKQFLEALSNKESEIDELQVLYAKARKEIGALRRKVMAERQQKANLQQTNSILKQAYILSTTMRDEHLAEIKDLDLARELFKSSVTMVEIEVFSYCNRVCWFCPNATYDRRSSNHHIDNKTYIKILEDLRSCSFDKRISFSRYNEPLADKSILNRISEAREYIPDATLSINTNGDYLNKEYLFSLYEAGLRALNIQIYLGNEEKYQHEKIKQKLDKTFNELDLEFNHVKDIPDTWIEASAPYNDMRIRIYGRNFDKNGCDRGGIVEVESKSTRISPCRSPFYHMYIDHTGAVMPCCNVRSDIPEHSRCKIGMMNSETSLFELYGGAKAANWRRAMVGFSEKEGVCKNCNFKEFTDSPETRKAQERILKIAADLEHSL